MSWWYTNIQFGSSSADTLTGGSGRDILFGGAGNDVLSGGDGNDSLFGGSGDDLLDGGDGNDLLFGGRGDDWMYGGAGHDWLFGGSGNDHISGGAGSDFLVAGRGNDTIQAGADSDIVFGGRGDDLILHDVSANLATDSVDFYHGGSGVDTLMLLVTADQKDALISAGVEQLFSNHIATHSYHSFNFETLGSILDGQDLSVFTRKVEHLVLNQKVQAEDDLGTTDEETILIGDSLFTNDDDEILDDFNLLTPSALSVAGVSVTINADGTYVYDPSVVFNYLAAGQTENDSFEYQIEVLDPFDNSVVEVQTATVHITITGTNDAPTAAVLLDQAAGEDDVSVNGTAITHSILIADILSSVTDVDNTTGFDLINASAAGLTIVKSLDGLSLDVTVDDVSLIEALNTGNTSVFNITVDVTDPDGGVLSGQAFDLTIEGQTDSVSMETIIFSIGESIIGSSQSDILIGTEGADFIVGDDGNDIIDGLGGPDVIFAGAGDDIIHGGANFTLAELLAFVSVVPIYGMFADSYYASDTLFGDVIFGGDFSSVQGEGIIFTNAGIDTSVYDNPLSEYSFDFAQAYSDIALTIPTTGSGLEGLGFLTITHNGVADEGIDNLGVINGMSDIEILEFNGDSYNLLFDLNQSTLTGTVEDDIIVGNEGDDTLNGNDGNDYLVGREGNDLLNGGAGNDVLEGGEGSDTFYFDLSLSSGMDEILDFNTGGTGDILSFAGVGDVNGDLIIDAADLDASGAVVTDDGTDVIISFSATDSITLNNLGTGSISSVVDIEAMTTSTIIVA